MRVIDFSDGFQSATSPGAVGLQASSLKQYISDSAYETAEGTPSAGALYYNTTDLQVRIYNGSAWEVLGPEDQSQMAYDDFILDSGEVTAKEVILSIAPQDPDKVMIFPVDGIPQQSGIDFQVIGTTLSWNGYPIDSDGLFEVSDQIRVLYNI